MEPGLLLQTQRNEVFEAVNAKGLDPRSFEWTQWSSKFKRGAQVSILRHNPSGLYFRFDFSNEGHWCEFSPGAQSPSEAHPSNTWFKQMDHVGSWLKYLRREIQAPDLWATLAGGSTLSAVAASAQPGENSPFSPPELKRIEGSLAEIRAAVIASHDISGDVLERIDANLTYLLESAERLGRKDWLNVAVSVVVNIIVTAAVPPETARHILTVAGSVLTWVLGGSPLLPNTLQ